jgi:hypothetical protein
MKASSSSDSSSRANNANKKEKKKVYIPVNKSKVSPVRDAIIIYIFCVSTPTFMGVILKLYSILVGDSAVNSLSFKWFTSNVDEQFNLLQMASSIYHFLKKKYLEQNAFSDLQFVIFASTILSLVRVILVHLLVPRYLAPRRLQAFVHSKSSHLLSSAEYQFHDQNKKNDDIETVLGMFKQSLRRSLGHEDHTDTTYLLDQEQTTSIFNAPRYATAVFRMFFCILSSCWALIQFRRAIWWPVWVFGQWEASTKYCWDLKGSFAFKGAALDNDFDHQNTALRLFFLGQASYQIHSLLFHFLSMMLLLLYGGNEGFLSARQSLRSYLRPLLEHSIYCMLTVTTYIFSGLRRLGAILIFALEMSSIMLQILQICINAPKKSRLRNPHTITFLHRFIVVPIFIYSRFFILPFVVQVSINLLLAFMNEYNQGECVLTNTTFSFTVFRRV